jgi:MFS family permease
MSAWRSGWVVSTFFLGGVLGAAASHRMNDVLGRRFALLFAGALTTASALLGALTTTYLRLLCVRTMFGFAMGVNKYAPGGARRREEGRSPGPTDEPSPARALTRTRGSASLAIYYAEITPKAERGVRHRRGFGGSSGGGSDGGGGGGVQLSSER